MSLRTAAFCLLVLLPVAAPAATKPAAPAPVAPTPVAPTAAAPKIPQPTTWESYRVLSERNIFTRNRSRPSSGYRGSGREGPPPPPVNTGDTSLVLTGIIRQGDDCVAFFEDIRTGKTTQFLAGAALGRGRLGLITEDTVHYACDGQLRKITIGSTLAGTAASFPQAAKPTTTTAAPAATSAGAPGAPPAPPGAVTMTTAPGAAPVGATPPPPEAPATAAAGTTTTQPPAAPPQAAAAPSGGGTAASILEERMRQRREQELGK